MSEKLYQYSIQKGVTFYATSYGEIKDLDIDDSVTELILGSDTNSNTIVSLRDVDKKFENIKKLIITNYVYDISISNYMFPNVEEVKSIKNRHFEQSGKLLIRKALSSNTKSPFQTYILTLLNTFIKSEKDVIDLKKCECIGNFAFEGCKSSKIINYNKITECGENAFYGYECKSDNENNGIISIGDILVNVKPEVSEIDISKYDIIGVPLHKTNIDTLIISSVDENVLDKLDSIVYEFFQINKPYSLRFVDLTLIDFDKFSLKFIDTLFNDLCNIEFEDSAEVMMIDNVLYSRDKTKVLYVKKELTGHIDIPEGVKEICSFAFYKSKISSVKLPDSLQSLKTNSFLCCSLLEHVDFGNGIKMIGSVLGVNYVFQHCSNLKTVQIPKQVRIIGNYAFGACGIENLILHDDIEIICDNAFAQCYELRTVKLPKNLMEIGTAVFSYKLNDVYVENLHIPNFINSLNLGGRKNLLTIHYKNNEIYIPKSIYQKTRQVQKIFEYCSDEEIINTMFCNYTDENNSKDRQIATWQIYEKTKNKTLIPYLKKCSVKIVERFINERRDLKEIIPVIETGFISNKSLLSLYDLAISKNLVEIAAYVLKEIEKNKTKKTSFKL